MGAPVLTVNRRRWSRVRTVGCIGKARLGEWIERVWLAKESEGRLLRLAGVKVTIHVDTPKGSFDRIDFAVLIAI